LRLAIELMPASVAGEATWFAAATALRQNSRAVQAARYEHD
jgi:hypothetical protein